ncbi:hypothetical protein GGX14DRAFT_578349 [Mycena pura]|uniref:Uncharacterized protein n=1 Tax=Mycena pura TaxID=153505 RepID=A0AAD6URL8_9AGAR|nr:hypothetical protein GGX14DRAFT_578349 [Mycena pura]
MPDGPEKLSMPPKSLPVSSLITFQLPPQLKSTVFADPADYLSLDLTFSMENKDARETSKHRITSAHVKYGTSNAVEIFDAAADFTSTEVEEYRHVVKMFPSALQNPASALLFNFFTVEDVLLTARGYSLYQEYSQSIVELQERQTASTASDRSQIVGACHTKHHFFTLDQAGDWAAPGPFNTRM